MFESNSHNHPRKVGLWQQANKKCQWTQIFQCLEIYQKVNKDEKIAMGSDLGQVMIKRKSTNPGPNGNPSAQIAIPTSNVQIQAFLSTSYSTNPQYLLQNQQPVQIIQRGNKLFEVPEEPENLIPSKRPLLEVQNIAPQQNVQ